MPKRFLWMSLLAVAGMWGSAVQPAWGQALIPHVLQLDADQLEEQGIILAQEAAQLAQFQQFELALPRAQLASQLAPSNAAIWSLLGNLYLQAEQYDDAIAALDRGRSLEPNNERLLFALGSAYLRKDDYPQAIDYIEAGLSINPDVPEAWFDLGNAYFLKGDLDGAIAQYEAAVELESSFWPAINNIGLVLYEQGDTAQAVEYWQSAVDIDSSQPEPQLALAVAMYQQEGRQQEAIALGEAALQIDSRYSDLDFLKENLWGDRLLDDASTLLADPQIQQTLMDLLGNTP